MRVVAVKRTSHRDRYHVTRTDGTEASWAVTSAPGLPHDLDHLVVESVLAIERGFWGLVDAGMEPAHVSAVADQVARGGGAADGALTGLLQAEACVAGILAPHTVAPEGVVDDERFRLAQAEHHLASLGVPAPGTLTADAVARIRTRRGALSERWAALDPGRALELRWPLDEASGDQAATTV